MESKSILSDDIVVVPVREIPRDYAKLEIARYIQQAGGRKVYRWGIGAHVIPCTLVQGYTSPSSNRYLYTPVQRYITYIAGTAKIHACQGFSQRIDAAGSL